MGHAVGMPGTSLPYLPPAHAQLPGMGQDAQLPGMGQALSLGHAVPAVMGQVLGLFQGDNTRLSQVRELEARHDMQLRIVGLLSQGGHGFF